MHSSIYSCKYTTYLLKIKFTLEGSCFIYTEIILEVQYFIIQRMCRSYIQTIQACAFFVEPFVYLYISILCVHEFSVHDILLFKSILIAMSASVMS